MGSLTGIVSGALFKNMAFELVELKSFDSHYNICHIFSYLVLLILAASQSNDFSFFYFYSGPVENIIRVHCFLDGKYNKTLYRVDPRTEGVWNASVHLHAEFFQISVTELHDLQLVESTNAEPRIRRADCKVTCRFLTARKVGFPTSPVCAVRGSTVMCCVFFFEGKSKKLQKQSFQTPQRKMRQGRKSA